ncbi:MAG: 4a-hydroxytetrahydrobiopterin dehydratase [Hyphomicrobiales bacterium]
MAETLNKEELSAAIETLSGWIVSSEGKCLTKCFKFKDFIEAFGWMTRVSTVINKIDHHPEWTNVYGCVDVTLCTHDNNGITQLDVDLARAMNDISAGKGQFDTY